MQNTVIKELEDLKEAVMKEEDPKDTFDPEKHIDAYLPVRVSAYIWLRIFLKVFFFQKCINIYLGM